MRTAGFWFTVVTGMALFTIIFRREAVAEAFELSIAFAVIV
jgi:hypothetical protein